MKWVLISLITILAFVERVWFDFGPNIELVTLVAIISAYYLDSKYSILLTLGVVITSDLIIGNSNIFLFTWSGFVLPLLFVKMFKKLNINKILSGTAAGISYNLFFFLWTNMGVWALDSWGMYPNTATGLLMSYINGLPFLKYQLSSTLFFLPATLLLFECLFSKANKHSKKLSVQVASLSMNG